MVMPRWWPWSSSYYILWWSRCLHSNPISRGSPWCHCGSWSLCHSPCGLGPSPCIHTFLCLFRWWWRWWLWFRSWRCWFQCITLRVTVVLTLRVIVMVTLRVTVMITVMDTFWCFLSAFNRFGFFRFGLWGWPRTTSCTSWWSMWWSMWWSIWCCSRCGSWCMNQWRFRL